MPYPDYRDFQLFYMLEPWGWENEEYLSSAIQARIYNATIRPKDRKGQDFFMRDRVKGIIDHLAQLSKENHLDRMKPEERKAFVLKSVHEFFGA